MGKRTASTNERLDQIDPSASPLADVGRQGVEEAGYDTAERVQPRPEFEQGAYRLDKYLSAQVDRTITNREQNLIFNYNYLLYHITNIISGENAEDREFSSYVNSEFHSACSSLARQDDPRLETVAKTVIDLIAEGLKTVLPSLWFAILDFLEKLPDSCKYAASVMTPLRGKITPMLMHILQTPEEKFEGGTSARALAARLLAEFGSLASAGPVLFCFRDDPNNGVRGDCNKTLQHLLGLGYDTRWPLDIPINKFSSYDELLKSSERHKHLVDPNGDSPPPPPALDERTRHLDALLATVPRDVPYEEQAEEAAKLNRAFRERLAERLAPALNARIRTMPHETHDQKKELAKRANIELRRFNLAIKHPKTDKPCYLVTDKGNHPEIGRFMLRSEGVDGRAETFSTPHLEALLEVMKLMDAPQREEGLSNWADKARKAKKPEVTQR
jgi:hypothetical protein